MTELSLPVVSVRVASYLFLYQPVKTTVPVLPFRFSAMSLESDDELNYKLLTRDKVEDALAIQAQTMKQENLAIGLGMFEEDGAPEEMLLVFKEVIKDGTTLIAVDKKTNELAAVAFNKLHARPKEGVKDELEVFIEENLRHQTCRQLVKLLDDTQCSVDIFERNNANGALELFYLGTNPRYQGRGIGRQMVEKCIEFGRGLLNGTMKRTSIDGDVLEQHVLPEIIFGVFASNYSQRIADKLGFEVLHEFRYEDYSFAGRKMSERIGDVHRTARLQVLKL
ncbi:arylalkylamine N-acetyltransferase 1-like isoform X1 [Bombus flavifrons]|uniref:arylalkylamine N-acetyltransferase 1-like isoform X1 n=1 Tax=Bombus flavifrons TaxID=103934 RepID=UPI00370396EE